MFIAISVKNRPEPKLLMKQKHDVAIKCTPTILVSVKRDRTFRWLEEMHLPDTALIRLCLESAQFWAAGFMRNIDNLEHMQSLGRRAVMRKTVTWP